MPLSIVVLQALESGQRADTILDRLLPRVAPGERQRFGAGNAVRLPCRLLPDEARAEVERRLDAIDADWRSCVMIRESRAKPSARSVTRSHTFGRPFTNS